MAQTVHNFAVSNSYTNIKENDTPTTNYLQKNWEL